MTDRSELLLPTYSWSLSATNKLGGQEAYGDKSMADADIGMRCGILASWQNAGVDAFGSRLMTEWCARESSSFGGFDAADGNISFTGGNDDEKEAVFISEDYEDIEHFQDTFDSAGKEIMHVTSTMPKAQQPFWLG